MEESTPPDGSKQSETRSVPTNGSGAAGGSSFAPPPPPFNSQQQQQHAPSVSTRATGVDYASIIARFPSFQASLQASGGMMPPFMANLLPSISAAATRGRSTPAATNRTNNMSTTEPSIPHTTTGFTGGLGHGKGPMLSKHKPPTAVKNSSQNHHKKKKSSRPNSHNGGSTTGGGSRKRRLSNGSNSSYPSGTNGSNNQSNNLPTISIETDQDPNRLVNPLLEPLPFTGATTPAGTSSDGTPTGTIFQAGELLLAPEIVYHQPDTYPISYLARLLGFDVPVADQDTAFPTPVPDIASLPLATKKANPATLSTGETTTSMPEPTVCQPLGDTDDQCTLDYIDPVYKSLLQQGYDRSDLRAPSGTMLAKFHTKQADAVDRVLSMAKSLDVEVITTTTSGQDEWTFCDFARYNNSTVSVNSQVRRPNWKWQSHVIPGLPSTAFGMVALCNGIPKVLLRYQFQWLPIAEQGESELVMVVEGLAYATNAPTTIKVPSNKPPPNTSTATLDVSKTNDPTATPFNNEVTVDSTKDEATQEQGGADDVEATTPKSDPQQELETEKDLPTEKDAIYPLEETEPLAIPDRVLIFLYILALEHTRSSEVWYSLVPTETSYVPLWKQLFRMTSIPEPTSSPPSSSASSDKVAMVCDLTKCSTRYVLLKLIEQDEVGPEEISETKPDETVHRERLLVRLPNLEEAKAYFGPLEPSQQQITGEMTAVPLTNGDVCATTPPSNGIQRIVRKTSKPVLGRLYASAKEESRDITVGLRVTLSGKKADDYVTIHELKEDGTVGEETPELPLTITAGPSPQLAVLKSIPLVCQEISRPNENKEDADELVLEIEKKQKELESIEKNIEPTVRGLLTKAVEERIAYESPKAAEERKREKFILDENQRLIARRKEMDAAWEKQLEQDMDAVCNICDDGEVTPDNQILFCEACNVAVHQVCYGIAEIPAGDYYCIACRYFKRDQTSQDLARKTRRDPSHARASRPLPLPICCELCPVKQGAYFRCDNKNTSAGEGNKNAPSKWVHTACAKWQGLNFVDESNEEIIEDVADLKTYFRRLDKACCICQSKRGAYQPCRVEGCENLVHLLCARTSGLCEIIHGDSVDGPVEKDPWTLLCPDHSTVNKDELKREPVSVESLIQAGKELPWDPMPPPVAVNKPFNKMTGNERSQSLADPDYEQKFFAEMNKRFQGVRCEVCDSLEGSGDNLLRCDPCGYTVCAACTIPPQDLDEKKAIDCHSCMYQKEKSEAKEEFETPQCHLCFQKGGYLLKGFANPARNKRTYWKNNPKEFADSLFGKQLWCHTLCSFWCPKLEVDTNKGLVNCSQVVMSSGKGHINGKRRCGICGLTGGLKTLCNGEGCRGVGEKKLAFSLHPSCARQAGYEVGEDEEIGFKVHCYYHNGNEFNLRARIEDLLEIEKKRSGKTYGNAGEPMTLHQASRLLNQSLVVMRVLGWAWRWAEHWVESDSAWEPLLEPGQKEQNMTKQQLKIVDSTPESRCEDARRCRLAAFGAALRNRSYDDEEGFKNTALKRALRAVLHTQSLVGPLERYEIDFLTDWLGRAYRSKSRLLGFGSDKLPVANDGFCVHRDDNSPKYELGSRTLPGSQQIAAGELFETNVNEIDDFLKPELDDEGKVVETPRGELRKEFKFKTGPRPRKSSKVEVPVPKKRGRPPKHVKQETPQDIPKAAKRDPTRPKASQFADDSMSPSQSVAAMVPSAVRKRKRCLSPADDIASKTSDSKSSTNGLKRKRPPTSAGDYTSLRRRVVDRPPAYFDYIDPEQSLPNQIATIRGKKYLLQPLEYGNATPQNPPELFAIAGRAGVTTFKVYGAGRTPGPRHLKVDVIVEGKKVDAPKEDGAAAEGTSRDEVHNINEVHETEADGEDQLEENSALAEQDIVTELPQKQEEEEVETEVRELDRSYEGNLEQSEDVEMKEESTLPSDTVVEEAFAVQASKTADERDSSLPPKKRRKKNSSRGMLMGLDAVDLQDVIVDGRSRRRGRFSGAPDQTPTTSEPPTCNEDIGTDVQGTSAEVVEATTQEHDGRESTSTCTSNQQNEEEDVNEDSIPLAQLAKQGRLSSPSKTSE